MDIRDQWRERAAAWGFQFYEGIDGLMTSPHLLRIAAEELRDDPIKPIKPVNLRQYHNVWKHPFIREILSSVFPGIAMGNHGGYEFTLYGSSTASGGTGKQSFQVNAFLFFPVPLGLDLEITPAGLFTQLGKRLFPGSYIISNAPDLERIIKVTGKKRAEIASLIAPAETRERLKALFARGEDFKITDHGIGFKTRGQILDVEPGAELMERMSETARSLCL